MRKQIVAGNWKMNKTFQDAEELILGIKGRIEENSVEDNVGIIVCPSFPYLEMATDIARGTIIEVSAQNVNQEDSGAYTGEVSAVMLDSMNVQYCIVGHSERRKYFGETDYLIAKKIDILLKYDIKPIYCCGESLDERESEKHFKIVTNQVEKALFNLGPDDILKVIIAYEPVWAIGTGINATPEQAQQMHEFIRKLLTKKYGGEISELISILYGGSCNSKNARSIFNNPDVDGGLIGGASLDADEFLKVVKSISAP